MTNRKNVSLPLLLVLLLAACALPVAAQAHSCPADFTWALQYAPQDGHPLPPTNALLEDPCLQPALAKAFPERPVFYPTQASMPKTIQRFLQVSGERVTLQDGRFVSYDGCVPHNCPNSGLLWIDTAGAGEMIFAAILPIPGETWDSPKRRLWIYTSRPAARSQSTAEQSLPEAFLRRLGEWITVSSFPVRPAQVVTVTLVDHDNRMQHILPAALQPLSR